MGPGLQRILGWPQGVALGGAAVFGTGILLLPGAVAARAGPASLLSWIVMATLGAPLAFVLAHLAAETPGAGGIADYVHRALGARLGESAGTVFLGTVPVGGPVAAWIGASYLGPLGVHGPWLFPVAGALCLAAVVLNALGVELTGRAALIVVGAIVALLGLAAALGMSHVRASDFRPFAPHGWVPVGWGVAVLFWAYVGWEQVGHLAEEFRHPARDIPLATAFAFLLVSVVYLAVAFVTVGTGVYRAGGADVALARLYTLDLGPWAARGAACVALVVTYGTLHAYVAGFSRLLYARARRGELPAALARLSHRGTPTVSLALMAGTFMVTLTLEAVTGRGVLSLLTWTSGVFVLLYGLAMLSGIRRFRGVWRLLSGVGLAVCVAAYPFLGWGMIYPLVLLALGLVLSRGTAASGRPREHGVDTVRSSSLPGSSVRPASR